MESTTTAPVTAVARYEFSASENATISGTARWIRIFSWFSIVAGVLMAISGIFTMPVGIVNLVVGALYLVIGMWFRGAAESLSSVVHTAGNDITHLMTAMDKLGSAFRAIVMITAVALTLMLLASIFAAVTAVAMMN
jgi:hypothetical protein